MKLVILILIYAAFMAASLALTAWLLRRAFPGAKKAVLLLPLLVCGAALLFPLIGALVPDGPVCWFFQKWGNIFIGYLLYFLGPLLLVWIAAVLVRRKKAGEGLLSPAAARTVLTVLLVLTAAVNVLGARTARDIRVTRYELPKETLRQEDPLRIVLIADTHIGVNSSPALFEQMTEKVNAQEPDLVLVAGDIVTSAFEAMRPREAYAAALSKIRARLGTYVIYGNHDVEEPLLGGFTYRSARESYRHPEMEAFLASCGWQLLTDEVTELSELYGLVIAGRRDEKRPGDGVEERLSLSELLKDVPEEAPVLLLQHEPADLKELAEAGVDLSVSGHTHDGQIFPGIILTRVKGPQSYGLKDWNGAQVIVTSGVGYYGPPIRVGTVSEIVVIDLK